ncbi:hypothetical protein LXL04_027099 [Taraxacum kok-saghyz]
MNKRGPLPAPTTGIFEQIMINSSGIFVILRPPDHHLHPPDQHLHPPPEHHWTTAGPPSVHHLHPSAHRTTVGPPPDHCRTTATTGPPPDQHRTTAGPPPMHQLHPSAHRTTVGPPSDHRRTTVGAPPAPIDTSYHCRTTAGPFSDYRRCDVDEVPVMAVGSDGDSDSGSGGGPAIQERRERWAANNRVSRWGRRRSRRRGFSGGRRGREARLPRVGMEKKTARWGLQNGAVVATRKTQAGGGDGRKETQ